MIKDPGTDAPLFHLKLSGVNIWSSAWSEAEVPDIASSCQPSSSPPDVFAWSKLMTTPSAGVTQALRVPSECDGECDKRLSESAEKFVQLLVPFT